MNSVHSTDLVIAVAGKSPATHAEQHMGVQRIEDPHYPRGYRELRSPQRCVNF